jgi:hypothetical protein
MEQEQGSVVVWVDCSERAKRRAKLEPAIRLQQAWD